MTPGRSIFGKGIHHLGIGDLRLALAGGPDGQRFDLDEVISSFTVDPGGEPDIRITIGDAGIPEAGDGRLLFTAAPEGLWSVHATADRYLVTLQDVTRDSRPYLAAVSDPLFRRIVIRQAEATAGSAIPFAYPLSELVVIAHAALNGIGILLHAAAVRLAGHSYLFTGVSGAGKSTIAELWLRDPEALVLTDERSLVRGRSSFTAHGTPWHGTAAIHRNAGAPLAAIFFLRHGPANRLKPLSAGEAANRLLVRCFPPFWHREGMAFAMDFCIRLARELPCYEFDFIPEPAAVRELKKFLAHRL